MASGANARPIIIKKVKKGGHAGHHGGAWKVAYADFVTAMMAFFLLMWLINTTSPEQKKGIADYFAPASVSPTTSGSGGILGGTGLGDQGPKSDGAAAIAPAPPDSPPKSTATGKATKDGAGQTSADAAQTKAEDDEFKSAAESLRQALQDMPELAELSKQVIVDVTPEGLRIQLVDQEGRSMFEQGSTQPNPRARLLLQAVSKIIAQLHNRITIAGHTSANAGGGANAGGDDWALSAARANASRVVLEQAGIAPDRVYQVSGKATSEPLYPDDPTLPGNRRIAITLLREKPVLPPDQS